MRIIHHALLYHTAITRKCWTIRTGRRERTHFKNSNRGIRRWVNINKTETLSSISITILTVPSSSSTLSGECWSRVALSSSSDISRRIELLNFWAEKFSVNVLIIWIFRNNEKCPKSTPAVAEWIVRPLRTWKVAGSSPTGKEQKFEHFSLFLNIQITNITLVDTRSYVIRINSAYLKWINRSREFSATFER